MSTYKAEYSTRARNKCISEQRCINCGLTKDDPVRQLCSTCITRKIFVTQLYIAFLRTIIIDAYGGKCSCCGESNVCFLSIDHIDNNGAEERLIYKGQSTFYNKIINEHFPATYRLLCHSCNLGRYFNGGICPHKESF